MKLLGALLALFVGFNIGVVFTALFIRRGIKLMKMKIDASKHDEAIYLLRIIAHNVDGGGRENVRILSEEEMKRRARLNARARRNVKKREEITGEMAAEEYLRKNDTSWLEDGYKAHKKFEDDWADIKKRLNDMDGPDAK